jgi:uncharacterized OB-fold protein
VPEEQLEGRLGQERLRETGRRPLPIADDLTEPYWRSAAHGVLTMMACADCQAYRHPPASRCPHCGSSRRIWRPLSGLGTVYSFIVDHRLMVPGFTEPYIVVLVEPEETKGNVQILTNLLECDTDRVYVGMPVEAVFERIDGVALPQFRPRKSV